MNSLLQNLENAEKDEKKINTTFNPNFPRQSLLCIVISFPPLISFYCKGTDLRAEICFPAYILAAGNMAECSERVPLQPLELDRVTQRAAGFICFVAVSAVFPHRNLIEGILCV